MPRSVAEIVEDILKLPHEEQFRLYDELSVKINSEDGYDEVWKAEIERRTADLAASNAVTRSWEEVEASLRNRLKDKV
jgi:putative addiction module component (TIGR02574 family)